MKGNNTLPLVLVSILLLYALAASYVQHAAALAPPVFPLDPPIQITTNPSKAIAPVGETVDFSIYVSTPVDLNLYGWQLRLQWDPSILNFSSSTNFWGTGSGLTNSTAGKLLCGAISSGSDILLNVSSGSISKVFTVTFLAVGYGIAVMDVAYFALLGRSGTGNGWTPGTDPYNGISEFTQYERFPDLNGDGNVTIDDAILLTGPFGSTVGDTNYNSACDFNNDGSVDYVDVAILGSHFGNSTLYPIRTIYVFNHLIADSTVYGTIPGDITGDFIVDIYDAILLSNAYNSQPGSPNWNANADINNDDNVDIYDAIILANHYNQRYP